MKFCAVVGLFVVYLIPDSQASIKSGSSIECFTDMAWCKWCGSASRATSVRKNCEDFCDQCDVDRAKKMEPASASTAAPTPPTLFPTLFPPLILPTLAPLIPATPAPLIPATPAPLIPATPAPLSPATLAPLVLPTLAPLVLPTPAPMVPAPSGGSGEVHSPAPAPSGNHPPTDAEADEMLDQCCVSQNVHPNCRKLCRYGVTLIEIQAATLGGGGCPLQADKFNDFFACVSQGHDNTDCCTGKGIGGVCNQFCQAAANIQTFDTRYLSCTSKLEGVLKCHRDGLNNV